MILNKNVMETDSFLDVNNDIYTLAGNTCYVKDSILYISSNPAIIEKIMK